MVYTITGGRISYWKARLAKAGGVLLPVLALLFLLTATLSFSSHYSRGQQPYIPLKNLSSSRPKSPKSADLQTNTQAQNSAAAGNPAPALSLQALSPNPSTSTSSSTSGSNTTPTTGGLGGGSGGSQPLVVCDNTGTLLQLCTACVPSLILQPGQKALLQSDGTCLAVN